MHTSNTLSRLQNIADTPDNKDNKDVIPLNLMMEKYSLLPINPQQLTPAQTG